MIAIALALLLQATAEPQTVVVTATYGRLAADLRKCEREDCGTLEDITATVRFAEAAFRKGDYRAAREALRRSVGRNANAAPRFPEAVSTSTTPRPRSPSTMAIRRSSSPPATGAIPCCGITDH